MERLLGFGMMLNEKKGVLKQNHYEFLCINSKKHISLRIADQNCHKLIDQLQVST